MYSRSERHIPLVDYKLLNSVGFENKKYVELRGGQHSIRVGTICCFWKCTCQNGDDNELLQLRDTVAKKEAEKKKLIEAEKKRLREELDKSTQEVEVLKSKKQKKGTRKTELTINTLRSDKKIISKVASQLH